MVKIKWSMDASRHPLQNGYLGFDQWSKVSVLYLKNRFNVNWSGQASNVPGYIAE